MLTTFPSSTRRTHCTMSTSGQPSGAPRTCEADWMPLDVPVMVGPPEIDRLDEAAAALVQMICRVGEEVRRRAVAPHEHAVLLVPELGRAEPLRAVLLIDDSALLEKLERLPKSPRRDRAPTPGRTCRNCTPKYSRSLWIICMIRSSAAWPNAVTAASPESASHARPSASGISAGDLDEIFAGVSFLGKRHVLPEPLPESREKREPRASPPASRRRSRSIRPARRIRPCAGC